MGILHAINLSVWQLVWVIVAAFLVGFSKTGISGFLMPVIPILASAFGGKESTGIILPLLIVGDAFALYYYQRHAEWNNIKKLIPWTYLGLIIGVITGNSINDQQFKMFIAISVILCLIILIYMEKKGENLEVPKGAWFYAAMGALSGFTSMIGNAAGSIFSVYLLAMGFKKNSFMGTTAWFFLIVNLSKLPLQVFFWHNISLQTLGLTLVMIPAIAAGALLGAVIIKKVNEKQFRILIIVMTAATAVRLLV